MNKVQLLDEGKVGLKRRGKQHERPMPTTTIATLAGFDGDGRPLVELPGSPGGDPVAARQTCPLSLDDISRDAVITFEDGDRLKPIILGLLQVPGTPAPLAVRRSPDGGRIEISAEHEIVLMCGKASITLTRAGKVLIRGAYLLSRSSGVNRIRGGSVQIN